MASFPCESLCKIGNGAGGLGAHPPHASADHPPREQSPGEDRLTEVVHPGESARGGAARCSVVSLSIARAQFLNLDASPDSLTFIQFHRRAADGFYPGLLLPCVTELPRAHRQDAFAEDWRSASGF
jgi:hypothetical protein